MAADLGIVAWPRAVPTRRRRPGGPSRFARLTAVREKHVPLFNAKSSWTILTPAIYLHEYVNRKTKMRFSP